MATEESSLTDFEYRVVGIPGLEDRIYNQEGHAKSAVTQALTGWPNRMNRAALREVDIARHIQIRFVSRGAWMGSIREVFGFE